MQTVFVCIVQVSSETSRKYKVITRTADIYVWLFRERIILIKRGVMPSKLYDADA